MFVVEVALKIQAGIIVFDAVALSLWIMRVKYRERRQAKYGEVRFVSAAAGAAEDRAIARARLVLNQ